MSTDTKILSRIIETKSNSTLKNYSPLLYGIHSRDTQIKHDTIINTMKGEKIYSHLKRCTQRYLIKVNIQKKSAFLHE